MASCLLHRAVPHEFLPPHKAALPKPSPSSFRDVPHREPPCSGRTRSGIVHCHSVLPEADSSLASPRSHPRPSSRWHWYLSTGIFLYHFPVLPDVLREGFTAEHNPSRMGFSLHRIPTGSIVVGKKRKASILHGFPRILYSCITIRF